MKKFNTQIEKREFYLFEIRFFFVVRINYKITAVCHIYKYIRTIQAKTCDLLDDFSFEISVQSRGLCTSIYILLYGYLGTVQVVYNTSSPLIILYTHARARTRYGPNRRVSIIRRNVCENF